MSLSLIHDWELEATLLGGLLLDGSQVEPVAQVVRAETFTVPAHRELWRRMLSMSEDGGIVDVVTILAGIDDREMVQRVVSMPAKCPSVELVPHYARRLRDLEHRRLMQMAADLMRERAGDPMASLPDLRADLERMVETVYAAESERIGWTHLSATMDAEVRAAEDRRRGVATVDVVPTGWGPLDDLLGGGIRRTDLCILAGRPAMGKSAVALHMALNAARHGRGVGLFSLEMSAAQVAQRALANLARVPMHLIRVGTGLRENDVEALARSSSAADALPVWIDATADADLGYLRSQIRRLKQSSPDVSLVVIDYLQLLRGKRGKADSRETEVAGLSRGLKLIAKAEDVAVVCLAQLNRQVESREDKRPKPSDLRESGSLEQDADVILFPFRPGVYDQANPNDDRLEVIVAKQRGGDIGTAHLRWLGQYQAVEEADARRARTYDARDAWSEGYG